MVELAFLAVLQMQEPVAGKPTGETLQAFAAKQIPPGMKFAHPAVEGQFGSPGRHVVLLYRPADDTGEYRGTVLMAAPAGYKRYELPSLELIPNQFDIEVKSVFFESVTSGPERELFVLYAYHRTGGTSDDGHACAVYQWRDDQFVRLEEVEKRIAGLATAAAIRMRLRPPPAVRKSVRK